MEVTAVAVVAGREEGSAPRTDVACVCVVFVVVPRAVTVGVVAVAVVVV